VPPYPIEINPAISTLVENAQRTNPALGKKTKDIKKKKIKGRTSVGASLDTDMTDFSEDMLGDMDPDGYKEEDNLADLKRKMKEWARQKDNEDEDEKEGEEHSESPEGITEDKDKENEKESPEDGAREEAEVKSGEEFKSSSDEVNETSDLEKFDGEIEDKLVTGEEAEEINKITKDSIAEEVRKLRERLRGKSEPDIMEILRKGAEKSPETDGSETVKLSEREREELILLEGAGSEFISLLSHDDGFIIADTSKKKKVVRSSANEIKAAKKVNGKKKKKAVKKGSSPLSLRFKEVFNELVFSESRGIAYKKLCRELKIFGIGVLEACRKNNERVLLLPMDKSLADYSALLSKDYDNSINDLRYGYLPGESLMIIGEETILNGNPRINIPVLYFAYSFDHTLGDDGFSSEESPAVLSNFDSCTSRENGHLFIDSYSSFSPTHYFAQSIEAFLTAPHGQLIGNFTSLEDPICTKEELYDADRSMYVYLEYLFQQVNRGEELKSEDEQNGINGSV